MLASREATSSLPSENVSYYDISWSSASHQAARCLALPCFTVGSQTRERAVWQAFPAMTAATHRPDDPAAVHSAALSAFLQGPAKGMAAVESLPAYVPSVAATAVASRDDPENIRRRRWGAGAGVERASCSTHAPTTPPNSAGSWWQKTSWFADGAGCDVAPVLADPMGADHGSAGSIPRDDADTTNTCRNRFTGPGQRDPIKPATAGSVRLTSAAVEDPGELYGGANATARASGGGAYTPVGGAMVHSRMSIQPRLPPRAMSGKDGKTAPRCADAFELELRNGAAPTRVACAVASAAAQVRYDFDFTKGAWEVKGTGTPVPVGRVDGGEVPVGRVDGGSGEGSDDADACDAVKPVASWSAGTMLKTRGNGDGNRSDASSDSDVEMDPEQSALMESTRDLRLHRFGAGHDAALATALAKRRAREAFVAAATLKRAAEMVPLPPLGAPRFSRRIATHVDDDETNQTNAHRWRMLRLSTGDVVYFDSPGVTAELVTQWIAGDTPWPEIRTMELSLRERAARVVPAGAPGPLAHEALARAAREELRVISEEDAVELAAKEEKATAGVNTSANTSPTSGGFPRLPPGSTATPQQANIIDRLVDATGVSRGAFEAAAKGTTDETEESTADRDLATLKQSLRENILAKFEFKQRAVKAEARVVALEQALAAAGIEAPPSE